MSFADSIHFPHFPRISGELRWLHTVDGAVRQVGRAMLLSTLVNVRPSFDWRDTAEPAALAESTPPLSDALPGGVVELRLDTVDALPRPEQIIREV